MNSSASAPLVRIVLAAFLIALPAACAAPPEKVSVTAAPVAPTLMPLGSLALRIEGENERARMRLAAIVNDMLARRGIRPDPLASEVLVVNYLRPQMFEERMRPRIGIGGRVGSSSKPDVGIIIGFPWWGSAADPEPALHTLKARLERVSPETLLWRGEARAEAVPEEGLDAELATRLAGELIDAMIGDVRAKVPGAAR